MGKVSVWLKRSYIGVISVIAGIGILMLGFTLFSHGYMLHEEELEGLVSGFHFAYGFSSITLLLTIIGGFGVWKEKKWALILFTVGMILCTLYLIVNEIGLLLIPSQLEVSLENHYISMMPLSKANETEIAHLNNTQSELQCCGLLSYKDWDYEIPKSCLCSEKSTNPCVAAPRNSSLFIEDQIVMIYAKPCLSAFSTQILKTIHAVSGILVGFILLWVWSVASCIAILCQLNKKVETPKVVYSSEAKAGNYTSLTEAPDTEIT
uniref:Tetraspanin n=1 Tax=Iconisemion striatum TaxID=60296 RepID=A0A1A7YAQ7_9TELE